MNKKDQTIIDFFPSSFWKEMFGEKKFTPQFNKNWNHLMPIVEALENEFPTEVSIDVSGDQCHVQFGYYNHIEIGVTKIETVYKAIVKLIEYCNGSNIKFPTQ